MQLFYSDCVYPQCMIFQPFTAKICPRIKYWGDFVAKNHLRSVIPMDGLGTLDKVCRNSYLYKFLSNLIVLNFLENLFVWHIIVWENYIHFVLFEYFSPNVYEICSIIMKNFGSS